MEVTRARRLQEAIRSSERAQAGSSTMWGAWWLLVQTRDGEVQEANRLKMRRDTWVDVPPVVVPRLARDQTG